MRDATVQDLPGVYRVCLMTGLAGRDATDLHADPDLLGHVWVGPYLLFPDAVALVAADDEGVAAYCVGVPDTGRFEEWLEAVWLPPLRSAHPSGSGATNADRALVDRIHAWPRTNAVLLQRYPAHLHIDILPRLQGLGWGRRLVDSLLAGLTGAGATGVHLGVDSANEGAARFYERLGFGRVGADGAGGDVLGVQLPRD